MVSSLAKLTLCLNENENNNSIVFILVTCDVNYDAGANDAQKTAGIILAVLAASGYISIDPSNPEQ